MSRRMAIEPVRASPRDSSYGIAFAERRDAEAAAHTAAKEIKAAVAERRKKERAKLINGA